MIFYSVCTLKQTQSLLSPYDLSRLPSRPSLLCRLNSTFTGLSRIFSVPCGIECSRHAHNMLQILPIILFRTAPKLTDYAFRFTYYYQLCSEVAMPTSSLACIAVVLALPVGIWWRLRQLPIAKYGYTESIPSFLLLNCCTRLFSRRCLDWERVAGVKYCPLCSVLALAYYTLNYAGILCASCSNTHLSRVSQTHTHTQSRYLVLIHPLDCMFGLKKLHKRKTTRLYSRK